MNEIELPKPKKLTVKQMQELANFVDPAVILKTLADAKWTIPQSIELLVEIAKNCEKAATQLNAIKYLNQLAIDAMERSGLMVVATKKYTGESGAELKFTGHVVSSSLKSQKETDPEYTTVEEITASIRKDEDGKNTDTDTDTDTDSNQDTAEGYDDFPETSRETSGDGPGLSVSKPPEGAADDPCRAEQFGGIAFGRDPDSETIGIL